MTADSRFTLSMAGIILIICAVIGATVYLAALDDQHLRWATNALCLDLVQYVDTLEVVKTHTVCRDLILDQ